MARATRTWVTAWIAIVALGAFVLPAAASTPSPPRRIKDVKPVYPPASLRAGDEASILVEAKVNASGIVDEVRILESQCPRLNEAARAAVRQWRWEPLLLNRKPVPFIITVLVPFRLPDAFKSRAGRAGACRWQEPRKPVRQGNDDE